MYWESGILPDGVTEERSDPVYELFDADTGGALYVGSFPSPADLEVFIAQRYPDCERWMPPLASAEDAAKLDQALRLIDEGTIGGHGVCRYLTGVAYRSAHPPETSERIWAALAKLG